MANNRTLITDEHVVIDQVTGPSPKYKGQIVTTITIQNLRTSLIKTVYVVETFNNRKNWSPIISYPDDGFVITNVYDKDLDNINADSLVKVVEHITKEEALEIARITAERNKHKKVEVIKDPEPKQTKRTKASVDLDLFNKNFSFGE